MPDRTHGVGAACALLLGSTIWLSSLGRPGADPVPALALLAAAVVVVTAAARATACHRRLLAPVTFAVSLAVLASIALAPDGLSGRPLAGPLGYGNANGALCAQGAAFAAMTAAASRCWVGRACALALGAAHVYAAWRTGSAAGAASAVLIVLGTVVLLGPPKGQRALLARAAVVVGAGVASAAILGSVALALSFDARESRTSGVAAAVDRTLTERRVVLWAEAVDLAVANPWRGVGAGRFAVASPTVRTDADARWAHSAPLQLAAESGLSAAFTALGLAAAVLVGLFRAARWSPVAGVGGLALGALIAHAGIDYVLHFPAVVLLAAAATGAASAALASGNRPVALQREVRRRRLPAHDGPHLHEHLRQGAPEDQPRDADVGSGSDRSQ